MFSCVLTLQWFASDSSAWGGSPHKLLTRITCFLYDFVTTGIFRYFELEILYGLLNRHVLISVNGNFEVFGSFSTSLLPI